MKRRGVFLLLFLLFLLLFITSCTVVDQLGNNLLNGTSTTSKSEQNDLNITIVSPTQGEIIISNTVDIIGEIRASYPSISNVQLSMRQNKKTWTLVTNLTRKDSSNLTWVQGVELSEGTNWIDLQATTQNKTNQLLNWFCIYSTKYVKATILTPSNGTVVSSGSHLDIYGSSSIDIGHDVIKVQTKNNNGNWQDAIKINNSSWNSWSSGVDLIEGTNIIQAKAIGDNGLTNTVKDWKIIYAPLYVNLNTTYPTNNTIVNNTNFVSVFGTSKADYAHSVTNVQIKVNDGIWKNASGTTNWSNYINIPDETNTVQIRAIGDNRITKTISQTIFSFYNYTEIYIDNPTNYSVYNTNISTVNISGTVTIDQRHSIDVNDIEYCFDTNFDTASIIPPLNIGGDITNGTNWYRNGFELINGTNYFSIRAMGNNGITNAKTITLIQAPFFVNINVTSHNSNEVVHTSNITLSGTSEADLYHTIKSVDISTNSTNNGTTWEPTTGTTNWTNWTKNLTLNKGDNDILIRGIEVNGITNIIHYPIDYAYMDLSVTSPLEDYIVTNEPSITLSGKANVEASHQVTNVEISTNSGTNWLQVTGTSNWSINLGLSYGTNNVSIRAMGNNGITNSTNWHIIRSDFFVGLNITSHTNNEIVQVSNITLSGTNTIDPYHSITNVKITVSDFSKTTEWEITNNTTNWSKQIALYDANNNTITVKAMGDNGITTSTNLTINYYYVDLAVTAPSDYLITNSSTVTMQGTTKINNPNFVTVVDISTNSGLSWSSTQSSDSWLTWSTNLNLSNGTNNISIRAIGNNGITNSTNWHIVYSDFFIHLDITSHTNNETVSTNKITLSGTSVADPYHFVTNVQVSTNNGTNWSPVTSTNNWTNWSSTNLTLHTGTNSILVISRGDNGISTNTNININYSL